MKPARVVHVERDLSNCTHPHIKGPFARFRDALLDGDLSTNPLNNRLARHPSRWALVQLLAGHPAPKTCLFLGATLGGDLLGAARIGQTILVADPDEHALAKLHSYGVPQTATIHTHPKEGMVSDDTFDIVWVTPWWLEAGAREGVSVQEMIRNAARHMAPGGNLIVHYLARHISNATGRFASLISGTRVPADIFGELPEWNESKLLATLDELGLRRTGTHHVASSSACPYIVVQGEISPQIFGNAVFRASDKFRDNARKIVVQELLQLGMSADRVLPFRVLQAVHANSANEQDIQILWARATGRAITAQVLHGKEPYYIRLDPGCGSVEREVRLLNLMAAVPELKDYVDAPSKVSTLNGLQAAWYPHLRVFKPRKMGEYRQQMLAFLEKLSRYPAPDFLEPAADRLERYLVRRLPKSTDSKIQTALNCLHGLVAAKAFESVTHGELRAGNLLVSKNSDKVTVVDWVQAYKGHPLIDWWTYNYWKAAPQALGDVPANLRLGLSDDQISDLWTLWRVVYNR